MEKKGNSQGAGVVDLERAARLAGHRANGGANGRRVGRALQTRRCAVFVALYVTARVGGAAGMSINLMNPQ